MQARPRFLYHGAGLFAVARGKRHLHAGGMAPAGKRGAEPRSGADNQYALAHGASSLPISAKA